MLAGIKPLIVRRNWLNQIITHSLTKVRLGVLLFLLVFISSGVFYTRAGTHTRVYGQAAETLNFQARLLNANGSIASDGTYSVEFKLYDASSGGTALWTETQVSVTIKDGYMSVYLADTTAFPGTIDWSQQHWLTMNVNADGEMTPRIRLTAVPYAFRANQANSLTDGTSTITASNLLHKAPLNLQSVNASVAGLRFNQTGSGGLVQLQGDGTDVFTVNKAGNGYFKGTLTSDGGLVVTAGGASITGGLNNNSGGITNAGALSGVTTISASGAIAAATSSNTINGLVINSGALSSITGITFTSGSLNLNNGGITNTGSIAGATTITASGNINTSGGAIQTNGITRITNTGALQDITTISASGNIAITNTSVYQQNGLSGITVTPCANNQYIGNGVRVSGGIITNGSCRDDAVTLSDVGLKENIQSLGSVLDSIKSLDIITYDFRCEDPEFANLYLPCNRQTGVSAQQLESIFPDLVTTRSDGYKEINIRALSFYSFKAITELAEIITASGDAEFNTVSIGGTLRLSSTGALQNINGLTVVSGGASITGGLNNNSGGITNAGALSGVTTISASGAIAAATSSNTINGLVINSGALSSITGITFTSGSLNLNNGGITNTGSIAGATTITASGNINTTGGGIQTNTITRLTSTGALQNVTGNNTNGVSFDANTITSGLLPVSRGGTGAGTFTANGIIYGNNTGALNVTAAGTGGQVMIANSSGVPTFTSLTGDVTISSTGLTTIGADAVALGTDTAGSYIANITIEGGGGLVVSGTGGETATASLTIRRDCSNNQIVKWSTSGSGSWNCAADNSGLSDAQVKNNVVTIDENVFDKLKFVRVVEFDFDCTSSAFNNLHCNTDHQAGVIAQELELIFPELVFEDSNGYKNVRYDILGFYNMRALGQLATIISANGDAKLNNLQTGGIQRLTSTGQLQNINGLSIVSGGASIIGGINNNSGGLTNIGSISGATTINALGRITGTNGLSITGETVNLNAGSNSATNINTGSSTGTVTIGGGSAPLVINSSAFKVSSSGALSGITTINSSGNINTQGVYQANGLSGLSGTCTGNNSYLQNWTITGGIITAGECRTGGILSDARLKENVVQLDSTLDKMKGLNVVTYDLKCEDDDYAELGLDCERQTGVIAQELAEIFPELVYQGQDGYYRVRSDALGFYNLKAVTEIASKLDSKGNATLNTVTTDGILRLTASGGLQNINGLALASGGASIRGGLDNNAGGLTNTGAVMGATTIEAKSIILNADATGNLLTLKKDNNGVFTVFNNGALELRLDSQNAFGIKNAAGKDYFSVNTKGGLVSIGSSTADESAVLLVLDSKSTEGDPKGVNGSQYYNAHSQRFRCYQDGHWQDCIPAATTEYIISPQTQGWVQNSTGQELPDKPRALIDLTNARHFRLMMQVTSVGNSGISCRLQYAAEESGNWKNLSGSTGHSLSVDKQGILRTDWVAIDQAARGEMLMRMLCDGGTGTQETQVINSRVQIK